MFSVAVKDHVMIAHSFRGSVFGPAQGLHGATYGITTEYRSETLDENGIVIDIGRALAVLDEVLAPLRFKNLDELPQFSGKNTTTEFMAHHIHEQISEKMRTSFKGSLRVVLDESHVAWGSFEAAV